MITYTDYINYITHKKSIYTRKHDSSIGKEIWKKTKKVIEEGKVKEEVYNIGRAAYISRDIFDDLREDFHTVFDNNHLTESKMNQFLDEADKYEAEVESGRVVFFSKNKDGYKLECSSLIEKIIKH
jgi:hypothetical protein